MAVDRSGPKVGVFGGTFDPVHIGHLRAAEEVAEALGLEKVLFVLSARPPHKGGLAYAPAEDRFEMLRRAVEGNPRFEASDLELRREGLSYSIDTVREILQAGLMPTFIIGEDAFRFIRTWKDWRELLDLCPFAVMGRTGEDLQPFLEELGYRRDTSGAFLSPRGTPLYLVRVTNLQVSATMVRDRVKEGRSIRYLVPDPVMDYILGKGLYAS